MRFTEDLSWEKVIANVTENIGVIQLRCHDARTSTLSGNAQTSI